MAMAPFAADLNRIGTADLQAGIAPLAGRAALRSRINRPEGPANPRGIMHNTGQQDAANGGAHD